VDHRIKWFWDDMSREELLLYFFLVSTSNVEGCSWYSTRQITKVLKIGPATMIKARETLEERKLIATRKDELSGRTVYQMLPLPMIVEDRKEVPYKKEVKKKGGGAPEKAPAIEEHSEDQHEKGLRWLEEIQAKLRQS
jgi:hypothetical protein